MNSVLSGDTTETAKSVTDLTIDVFPDNREAGVVVFQPIVPITKVMQNDIDPPETMEKPWPESEARRLIWNLQLVLKLLEPGQL